MLIEKIILQNFRVYNGHNEVTLSVNPEKNVTIISGQNGFGKTSLLTALVWCLYGKNMPDVDERYRKDISESGGYKKHAIKLMNRVAYSVAESKYVELQTLLHTASAQVKSRIQQQINDMFSFSVSLKFTNIFIPHLACNEVEIKRTFNTFSSQEELEVLIDGRVNELTKTMGQEVFIYDFILPKEIAKFFFFDAEKITALAEVNNIEEKRYFSKAYNEVLGIKKYTDLKQNLENIQLKLRKKSANKGDLNKIEALQSQLDQAIAKQDIYIQDIRQKEEELLIKRKNSIDKHEQLIRAGSKYSNKDLVDAIAKRDRLRDEIAANKNLFNSLSELAPFAILAPQMVQVNKQLIIEERSQNKKAINNLLNEKLNTLTLELKEYIEKSPEVERILKSHLMVGDFKNQKSLLDYTPTQYRLFYEVFENIKTDYSKKFKKLLADQRKLQSSYNQIHKIIQDAELKANDEVIKLVKGSYETLSEEISALERTIASLYTNKSLVEREIANINKQLSEHSKHLKAEKADKDKVETSERLIQKLDKFISKLKGRKKTSLENNIQKELNTLLHKVDFVKKVEVLISGDLIDIDLYDEENKKINKDGLSKGEQQLYATALLKALVTESNIQFPVFIDSPLQKLDRSHSLNIIKDFYPQVSSQVVLFPLLEKELSFEEYQILMPKIGRTYLIEQSRVSQSYFKEIEPINLFHAFN